VANDVRNTVGGADAKVTLASAPAGFGKTTVLAGRLAQSADEPCAHAPGHQPRADSDLPICLARLRVYGDLVEVRAVDRRFTFDGVSAHHQRGCRAGADLRRHGRP